MPIADVFSVADGGGGTTTIVSDGKKRLIAKIDFSTQPNQTFSSDGDYTFTTSAGSSVPTVTGKWKNLANNAGGSMQITGGRLVANTPVVTSQFGKWYWSNLHAPILAFDVRTISGEFLADTTFEKWAVVVEVECDPMFTVSGSTYTSQVGTFCWTNAGVLQGGTAYFNGSATSPTRFISAAFRAEATTGNASNYAYNYFNFIGNAPSGANTGNTIAQFSANPAPWNSFANPGPTKWGSTYSARACRNFWATSTAKFTYYNGTQDAYGGGGDFWQNWNPLLNSMAGAYLPTANNDVWGYLQFSRSTGSGTTSVKVKALNIYIQEVF
jgi:hypothetical protein